MVGHRTVHERVMQKRSAEPPDLSAGPDHGLRGRGRIQEGYWADLVVFDLATIADKATFTQPHQYPEGIPYMFVNDVAVVDGKFTNATPGRC